MSTLNIKEMIKLRRAFLAGAILLFSAHEADAFSCDGYGNFSFEPGSIYIKTRDGFPKKISATESGHHVYSANLLGGFQLITALGFANEIDGVGSSGALIAKRAIYPNLPHIKFDAVYASRKVSENQYTVSFPVDYSVYLDYTLYGGNHNIFGFMDQKMFDADGKETYDLFSDYRVQQFSQFNDIQLKRAQKQIYTQRFKRLREPWCMVYEQKPTFIEGVVIMREEIDIYIQTPNLDINVIIKSSRI